jgi:hypothetical protein
MSNHLGRGTAMQRNEASLKARGDALAMVVQEMFTLLEDYAPTWYTEEHHNRVTAALQQRAMLPDTLLDLYQLLEAYGPAWYTEELHRKAESAVQIAKSS